MRRLLYSISFYFTGFFYACCGVILALLILAFLVPVLETVALIALAGLCLAVLADLAIVYRHKIPVKAERVAGDRFSNSDDNRVQIYISNLLSYKTEITVIDELPYQLQIRNWKKQLSVAPGHTSVISYMVKPAERGVYRFGHVNVFITGMLKMVTRQLKCGEEKEVAVYPSFLQMRRFELMVNTSQLQEAGTRRLRKLGSSLEFEQIREYVLGDDYRTINWQATARKSAIMVNHFMDERSQQVICLIDKGRTMKMPFEGLSLLDYAINASLALGNLVLHRQDKAGLLTFGSTMGQFIAPDKKATQLSLIMEALYRQETDFTDSNFEALYASVRYKIKQRSLLMLFTNFESIYGLERQLPYLKKLATHHPLLVIFFNNTELAQLTEERATTMEQIYIQTVAAKFAFEKKQMVRELHKHGIMSLLTTPQQLTADTLNKYFELKARQVM